MNQKLVLIIIRKGFTQLLCDPKAGGMLSGVAVQDSSAVMGDHEKAIQDAEGDCRNSEEIHRSYTFPVIIEENSPALCRLRALRSFLYPTRHSSFREVESQFQQFSVNARRTPSRILSHQAKDQLPRLFRNSFPSTHIAMTGTPSPIEPEADPMPPNHGFGRDDNERLFPLGPHMLGDNPEKAINTVEMWPRVSTFQGHELLTKGEILQ
jgi:hypothetical protein